MNWSARTRAVNSGRQDGEGDPANVPITPASHLGLAYAREDGIDTWRAFEDAVGDLEGGHATSFASGMGAISAVFDLLPSGAEVAVPTDSYAGTRDMLGHAEASGRLRARRLDPRDIDAWLTAAGEADLLWLESPTNPSLFEMPIAEITAAAAAADDPPIVAVDNTFATPLGQQPLSLGADVVMHSATKLIGGHSDLLLGVTVVSSQRLAEQIRAARRRGGATPGALEAWLALRGMRTLPVRYAAVSATASELVKRLREHPSVVDVRYPSIGGGVVSFELADAASADAFCAGLRLIRHATSLGGAESTLERRAARPSDAHVPAGALRFSVGLEDPDDLWADITQALEQVG
ncbi:trans-sulfuration enzyme family protein [Haloechinothrix halophila]|uniref:trans-sulfuration enzyme family protein n=1 Tax=Haloechinothrix halophila TaxID=1069073 RepID=UPI00040B7CCC|nr:PLP-dependent aspartate aminotransferase family protein [Haloechinothrix halophila]